MNKLKKQFKDFWTYCRLLKYGVNASEKTSVRQYFPFIFGFIVGVCIILGQGSSSGTYFRVSAFMPLMAGVAIATGLTTAYKPSLIGVAPYTPRQRVVFSYISTLVRGIILTVFWTVCMIVVILFFAFVAFIISGENLLVVEESVLPAVGAYGNAHEALFWVILVFAAYAISHLNGKKARYITLVCFFVGLEILTLVLVNLCGRAEQAHLIATGVNDGLVKEFFMSSDVSVTIDYLAHPWAVIVVEGVLAAAAFAASLYASIMRYKSSKI